MLWNSKLPEEEKQIWYIFGLKKQYLYKVKAFLFETYNQAKQLVLIMEVRIKGIKKEVKNIVNNRDINVTSKLEKNKIEDFLVINNKTMNDNPNNDDNNNKNLKVVDGLDHCDEAEVDEDKSIAFK
ncbi:8982_t:CDS:2 [Dentiscutata erythropus]|uniref:8982_t:CDS:1 n=1 Tax=Dentiscutata erythropus TaxID=1348616 RepID=A0A9N9ABX2_9GLOM|nr:8982_t:CDS:2 [Dentiscutata erythropus]